MRGSYPPFPSGVVKSGSYTGNGGTSQAITGIGFKPVAVLLTIRATADATAIGMLFTSTDIVDDNASGGAVSLDASGVFFLTNAVVSLDADGFTVDDDGADAHPNTNGVTYNYVCWGPPPSDLVS